MSAQPSGVQLSFPQPHKTSFEAHDFHPGPATAQARAMLEDLALWPQDKLALVGEQGSGKTHLLAIWAARHSAELRDASQPLAPRANGPVAVDNAHLVAGDAAQEEALFHLHNNLAAEGWPLLLSARAVPRLWGVKLPDLASRMEATSIARIEEPDDGTLTAILLKLMADRQLDPAPALPRYLVRRMGRSYAEAGRIVAALDGLALAEKRNITTALAARVLDAGAE